MIDQTRIYVQEPLGQQPDFHPLNVCKDENMRSRLRVPRMKPDTLLGNVGLGCYSAAGEMRPDS